MARDKRPVCGRSTLTQNSEKPAEPIRSGGLGLACGDTQGALIGRRIIQPTINRTLRLARPARRSPIPNEDALFGFLQSIVEDLTQILGSLARPLDRIR